VPTSVSSRSKGLGRILIFVYALLAIAATGRSVFQVLNDFEKAPLAYSLSALAGLIYIVATVALIAPGAVWYRVAVVAISFELLGVLVVGTLSLIDPVLFPAKTVWSVFGRGYAFVPLVLPILGLTWLWINRPAKARNAAL
jgi:hypothetical protein